jgi:hypothetical protein
MLEPVPDATHPHPIVSYSLDDLLADFDENLAELEEQSQPDRLTPMQVETAILQTLGQQITTLLARERLEWRAERTNDFATEDALADLDNAIAATAERIMALRRYRRLDELSPAQRQTILARTAALNARLLVGRARLCAEQAQCEKREERAQTRMLAEALPPAADVEAHLAAYHRQIEQLLTLPPTAPTPSPDSISPLDACSPQAAAGSLISHLHTGGEGAGGEVGACPCSVKEMSVPRADSTPALPTSREGVPLPPACGGTEGGPWRAYTAPGGEVGAGRRGQARPPNPVPGRAPGGAGAAGNAARATPAPQSGTKVTATPARHSKKQQKKQAKKHGKR